MNRAQWGSAAALALAVGLLGSAASGQIFYEFTSGPSGDGFNWPASPTGLLDGDSFFTPDGVDLNNYTNNNVFFDGQYQVASNSGIINGDALWGNPLSGNMDFYFGGVQSVSFDYAHAAAGSPTATPDYLEIEIADTDGRFTYEYFSLDTSFTGFGGVDGWAGNIELDVFNLFDITGEFEENDQFVDIDYVSIYLGDLDTGGPTSEFAVDNLSIDGGGGGGNGEVYPSVNDGANDVTGQTNNTSWVRGTGDAGIGLEVTNDSGDNTTYQIQLNPGGDLSSGTTVFGDPILDGESIFTADVALVDRSLPAGDYTSDVTTINNGDPSDPDNVSSLSIDLLDAPLLSRTTAPGAAEGTIAVILSNAAGPFRASVKLPLGISDLTGDFALNAGFDDVRVLPGESAQALVSFDRYGKLSGTRTGSLTSTVEMAHFIVNGSVDFEAFLNGKEAMPDQTWNLSYTLNDRLSDSGTVTAGLNINRDVGVNTSTIAATIIDGTAAVTQVVSMSFTGNPGDDASADILGQAVDVNFASTINPYVLQFTYDDLNETLNETGLGLLAYDGSGSEWVNAVDLNADGTAQFYSGSYQDFVAANPVSVASNLGAYGIDASLNHVWAIIDFEGAFAAGFLGGSGPLDGDYNGDGFVSQADLDLVLLNWGETAVPTAWVATDQFDGVQVSQNELDDVLLNWGNGTPPGVSAIPEPTTAAALLGLLATAVCRRTANR